MYQSNLIGIPQIFTAADTTTIGNVSSTATQPNINLIGVMAHPSGSDRTIVQIWAGTTATTTAAGVPITGLMVFQSGAPAVKYRRVPAYCSGGAVINITGNSAVTLFWNPAGG